MTEAKILFVDDEKNVLRSLQRLFMEADYEILTAESGEEGLALLAENPDVVLVVSDYRMPGMDGVEFLRQVCEKQPNSIRIVLSGYADTASVVAAINEGEIYRFIPKPWDDEELKTTIEKALEVGLLHQENKRLSEELLQSNEELKALNRGLEDQVKERVASLVFQNKTLVFSQNILHCLPIGVIGIDSDRLIVQSNKMADKILSQNNCSVAGMSSQTVLPEKIVDLVNHFQPDLEVNESISIKGNHYLVRIALISSKSSQFGTVVVFVPANDHQSA